MNYLLILVPLLANMMIDTTMANKKHSDEISIYRKHWARLYGTITMIAGFVMLQQWEIVHFGMLSKSWWPDGTTLILSAIAGLITLIAAMIIVLRQPNVNQRISIKAFNNYSKWGIGTVWIAYLICYESYCRVLLLPAQQNISSIVPICLNVFVYTLLHIHRPKAEILAAIPFGFFVCYCSIITGSVWPAFVAHAALAWFAHLGAWPIFNNLQFSNNFLLPFSKKQSL